MKKEISFELFLEAIFIVYPFQLTDSQTSYLQSLILDAIRIGGFDISKLVCDYLKINDQKTRRQLHLLFEDLLPA
ncbi:MAG: hypothetical protein IPO86_11255 [Saprospiraceae bacterium]|nr:hypothetical protein [Saprospiraceae bacterium]MBK9728687.1 hypothetical protein [Saprospiraceae bacterium]